ncbi:deoxyribonuclease IV [Candidatus Dependentiae bacterium]|nr:deoxyribonuclease IV [Candidatus Dependentiae bacterium]
MTKKILIGAHMSGAGSLHLAFDRGEEVGCTAMQIFTKSNRSWHEKPLTNDQIENFKARWKTSSIESIMVHASYLINIGSSKPDVEQKAVKALIDEVQRCNQLNIPYLVLHPGSHLGAGEEICIKQIAKNLDLVFDKVNGRTMILLETMAGQGTNVGNTFEQLAAIRSACEHKRKIAICLDTCHIFTAGYELTTEDNYKKIMKQFDEIIGLDNLKAIHLNDSKTACGSRVDRHECLGKGQIPLKIFQLIMNDHRLSDIPKILETPDPDLYKQEIDILKKMCS